MSKGQGLAIGVLSLFYLLRTFDPGTASAGPIEELKPGYWYEVPNSRIRDVLPNPIPPGATGPASVIVAWNSGAYDTKRDRLIVWGGGHGDYGGNEIYTFDINTLRWSRIWGPSPNIPPPPDSCGETYSDGNPVSRHTYDGLEYLPNVDRFWTHGGSLYCGGGWGTRATWHFDFGGLRWTRRADHPNDSDLGKVSTYDPTTGRVLVDGAGSSYSRLYEYDPVANAWIQRGLGAIGNYHQTATFDWKRKLFVRIGGGEVDVYDLSQSGLVQPRRVSTTGDTTMVNTAYPGITYDPVSDKIVAWHGGATVFTLNLDTWNWQRVSPAPTNTVIPTQAPWQGTYKRWRYVPSKNAFIGVNSIDENVWIYKLSGDSAPVDSVPPAAPTNLRVF